MARTLTDIERDIRALSARERARLLKDLISDLDAPADPDAEQAWLEESERRLAEIESGTAKTVPGPEVLKEARSRLK
ncbi:MAG TPA: addiction module protein [Steroidobacteraceae bacterium]